MTRQPRPRFRLKVPPPHVLSDDSPDKFDDSPHYAGSPERHSRWRRDIEEASDFPELEGSLPPLSKPTTFPQKFQDTLKFTSSGAQQWSSWRGGEHDERDAASTGDFWNTASAPELHSNSGRRQFRLPQVHGGNSSSGGSAQQQGRPAQLWPVSDQILSTFSYFQRTVRVGDVLLDPDLDIDALESPPNKVGNHVETSSASKHSPVASRKPVAKIIKDKASGGGLEKALPLRQSRPLRSATKAPKSELEASSGLPQQRRKASVQVRVPEAGLGASASEGALPRLQSPIKKRLPQGPVGLWEGRSRLHVVRDLLDGYAADPLRASPLRRGSGLAAMVRQRPGSSPQRPGSSAQRPGSSAQRPGSSAQRPGSSAQRPGSSVLRPSSSAPRPGSSAQRPGSSMQRPGSSAAPPRSASPSSRVSVRRLSSSSRSPRPGSSTMAGAVRACSAGGGRPSSSGSAYSFLELYVERQAQIESLLSRAQHRAHGAGEAFQPVMRPVPKRSVRPA